MNYHRGLLFWGLALITGGAVALAAQQGYIDREWLSGAWRLWPLILVAIGLSILLARTPAAIVGTIIAALIVGSAGGALIAVGPATFNCGGADPTVLTTRQGTFGDSANVNLDFNCGTLRVAMDKAATGWTVQSGQRGGSPAKIDAAPARLDVKTSPENGNLFNQGRQRWNVALPTTTTYELDVSPNAADTNIDLGGGTFRSVSLHPNAGSIFVDLTDAQVDQFDLSLNAGSASIMIGPGPSAPSPNTVTFMNGKLEVNAGSIELCTTGDVALRITADSNITFSTNLDSTGLVKSGNTWTTTNYDGASHQVRIQLSGNAGSFALNPEGGCS